MLPNRESGPQNQPNANVAVFVSVGAAASMGGIVALMVVGVIIFSSLIERSIVTAKTAPTRSRSTFGMAGIASAKLYIFHNLLWFSCVFYIGVKRDKYYHKL